MVSRDLQALRDEIELFQGELMEEFYQNNAGLKDETKTVEIYDKHSRLFSMETIASVRSETSNLEPSEENRGLRYIRAFCTLGYLDSATKVLSDKANTFETRATVESEGEAFPYRQVPVKLRNEEDAGKRRKLFNAKLVQTDILNGILLERLETAHDLAMTLGFKNYRDLCSSIKGIDYKVLEEQMEELLRRTETLYVDSMDRLLRDRTGLAISEAWSFDIPYAFRGKEFDTYFAKGTIQDAFASTLKGMGIDPTKYTNILLDSEERPKKNPRAFCAAVKVPDDIRLVIRPGGGWRDYQAYFHEGGHAWHFGSTWKKHPVEYRYLGDNSVTEAFAFLLGYLPMNKSWLKGILGMKDSEEFIRFSLTHELMFLRRYAAKLIYELKLHQAKVTSDFQEVYRNCLQKSLKIRHTEKHYLEDLDDGFYCADYLRAWVLEGQLRAAVEEEFGEDWYANERTGPFLKELWSYGQKYTADELVKTVGYVDLDMDPMLRSIERGLAE